MTVNQLINKLSKVKNKNATVLLSSDSEINSVSFLESVETNFPKFFVSEEGYSAGIEFWEPDDHPGEKPPKGMKDCVVLFP